MATIQKLFLFLFINLFTINFGFAQKKDTAIAKQAADTIIDAAKIIETYPINSDSLQNMVKASAQVEKKGKEKNDTASLWFPNPRVASIRSAIIPGWGQVYNGKIWKVPIVYAALGVTGWYFLSNRTYYKQLRLGAVVGTQIIEKKRPKDSTDYHKIKDENVKLAIDRGRLQEVRYYRDRVRRELDYAVLYFAIAWALNVVEASVDAHLQSFDISPNLSFNIEPGYSELAKTSGISLVMRFK
jgi:hypothetical protein